MIARRPLLASAAPALLLRTRARAASSLRIGVLTDESGPYADIGGAGSVLAARLAAEEAGAAGEVEIRHADTQNKPDTAAAIAARWYDEEGVGAIVDLPVTPVALAVLNVARERTRTVMITAAATSDITARYCTPVLTHWADDTHALTAGTAAAVLAAGARRWFFITVDHTFGLALQRDASAVIREKGGEILGAVRHPIGATDYAPYLVQAASAKAEAIGLASVGGDLVNLLKQAAEFGLLSPAGPRFVAFLTYISDVHALGLRTVAGLTFASGFYWDQSDPARRFAERFYAERKVMPTKNHAAVYMAVRRYIEAVRAGNGTAEAAARALRQGTFDFFGRPARIREDGRVLYDLTLYRVKSPAESRRPWDYYTALATIPADQAFLPPNPACRG